MPAAYNSKTINDNEMRFGGVVKDSFPGGIGLIQ